MDGIVKQAAAGNGGTTGAVALARGVHSAPAPDSAPDQAASDIAVWRGGKVATKVVDTALAADNAVSALAARLGLSVPGLSTWALGQKS